METALRQIKKCSYRENKHLIFSAQIRLEVKTHVPIHS